MLYIIFIFKIVIKLKILIAFYSGTGNTEKIARAIKEAITEHDVELLPVTKVDPESLKSYDLIFLGSGIYAFNVSRKVMTLVKKATELPLNFAYFYTHESLKSWPDAFKSVNKIIEEKNCKVLGEFNCCGENLVEKAQEQREAMKSRLSAEESKKIEGDYLNYVKGHPDEKDLENAKKFAREILSKV